MCKSSGGFYKVDRADKSGDCDEDKSTFPRFLGL